MVSRLRWSAVVVAGVAGLTSASCGVTGHADRPGGTTTGGKTPTTGSRAGPEIAVTDAGSGPKAKLRLKLHKGTRTNLAVKVTTAITQTLSGQTQTVRVPPIVEDISLRIVDVRDGVASFHFTITGARLEDKATVPSQQSATVAAALRRLVGLTSDGTINERGATLSSVLHIPSSVPSTLRQPLQQLSDQLSTLSVPLPEQAVGPGAKWTSRSTANLSGVKVDISTGYQLTSVDGPTFTLAVTQRQTAKAQRFNLSTLPPGARARIIDYNISTVGTNTLKLGNILPEARLHSTGVQSFSLTLGTDKPQTVKQNLSIDTQVTDLGN